MSVAQRWWRWMTNPMPMVGQVWSVDGVGLVEITKIEQSNSFPLTMLTFGLAVNVKFSRRVVARSLSGEKSYPWPVPTFRLQAVIRPLTLGDLSSKDPPTLREVKR